MLAWLEVRGPQWLPALRLLQSPLALRVGQQEGWRLAHPRPHSTTSSGAPALAPAPAPEDGVLLSWGLPGQGGGTSLGGIGPNSKRQIPPRSRKEASMWTNLQEKKWTLWTSSPTDRPALRAGECWGTAGQASHSDPDRAPGLCLESGSASHGEESLAHRWPQGEDPGPASAVPTLQPKPSRAQRGQKGWQAGLGQGRPLPAGALEFCLRL